MTEPDEPPLSVLALCNRHLQIETRLIQLHELLGKAEDMLVAKNRWFDLTRVQRRTLPAAKVYYDLEDELEALQGDWAQLVIDLIDMPAASTEEAVAKLEVVARVIEPDDYPYAHAVLEGAIEDLRSICAR